jgi:hypothetical protein
MVKQAVSSVRFVARRRARRAVGSAFERSATGAAIVDSSPTTAGGRRGRTRAWRHSQRIRTARVRRWAVPLATLGLGAAGVAPAWGANVVNYTFHVPASVQINPCFPGDVVNLNGDIHVVVTSTPDGSGGYHSTNSINSQLKGLSITTGTGYVNSENQQKNTSMQPPFPAVTYDRYDFDLISQSATDNYQLHMQTHETMTAMGVPAVVVDHYWMDCRG